MNHIALPFTPVTPAVAPTPQLSSEIITHNRTVYPNVINFPTPTGQLSAGQRSAKTPGGRLHFVQPKKRGPEQPSSATRLDDGDDEGDRIVQPSKTPRSAGQESNPHPHPAPSLANESPFIIALAELRGASPEVGDGDTICLHHCLDSKR